MRSAPSKLVKDYVAFSVDTDIDTDIALLLNALCADVSCTTPTNLKEAMQSPHWTQWKKAIETALIPNQRREDKDDNFFGSWDAAGPWGEEGGRVYSTAICALILEVYYRYARVLGAR